METSPCSSTPSSFDEFDDDSILLIQRWRTPETKGIVTLSLKRVQKLSFLKSWVLKQWLLLVYMLKTPRQLPRWSVMVNTTKTCWQIYKT